ncbi:MAG: helix-turn-helix domain-containing protein [Candidatus Binataceae bacterium]
MTAKEVAEYLHVHLTTLYKLIRKDALPHFKIASEYRFNRQEIEKWMAERTRSD